MEKMRFWNHLGEYFADIKTREEEADPWPLLSLKDKKSETQFVSQTDSVHVAVPECIEHAHCTNT